MAFYAKSAISRALIFTSPSPFSHTKLLQYTSLFSSLTSIPISSNPSHSPNSNPILRHFTSSNKNIDTKLNFSPSDSDSDDESTALTKPTTTCRKLPPPYDPFSKKPAIEEPKDPKDLQEIFHKMRSGDGLLNHAVKMFDALSKQGLTHEALELFGQIKDKGQMPDVVAHTAIIEAYANAGQPKEAHKAYMRMLASGVFPNAYTYAVLIKGLAGNGKFLKDAKNYVVEMFEKGMRPNAETYTSVFEGLVKEKKMDEAVQLMEEMKGKGFVPDEKAVKEVLSNKRGPVCRTVINILFGK
ncbi:pentatricopeptide repeat-containing protein At4g38150-like [Vicia villosa]|uniref:pentatricopeptide repeat-containing protein At4g38150-like n=1 Tax=Vicia villosa TaxID=3911 RepID=UPI00273AED06|nr:pentatricopeptide repeat-containing protein At4g38150-like [Vicia villosa]